MKNSAGNGQFQVFLLGTPNKMGIVALDVFSLSNRYSMQIALYDPFMYVTKKVTRHAPQRVREIDMLQVEQTAIPY